MYVSRTHYYYIFLSLKSRVIKLNSIKKTYKRWVQQVLDVNTF